MFELPPQVRYALEKLNSAGFDAYLVGGGVRDALMGFEPKDYDITTSALPSQTAQVFASERLIETGIKHGTVTVLIDKTPLEITTFRIDGRYTDFRHPDSVMFSLELSDDLSRRDFTVNSLAYHPAEGVIDFFDGREDITRQIIRCVGSPEQRFQEDALRILRAIRFSSVLGFIIEDKTAAAIHAQRALLRHVSAERIFSEFVKLLCGKNVRAVLEDYIDVIGEFVPEAFKMHGCAQNCIYHRYDVLRHTAVAVESVPADPVLRLAAFFHDIGKPETKTTEKNGTDHFYGHAAISTKIAEQTLISLRADNKTVKDVTLLVQRHDVPIEETEKSVKRALGKLSEDGFFRMLQLKRADTAAQASFCHERFSYYDRLEDLARNILAQGDCLSLQQLAVNGSDLIHAGIPEGKEIGELLRILLDAVLDGKLPNEKTALLTFAAQVRQKKPTAEAADG